MKWKISYCENSVLCQNFSINSLTVERNIFCQPLNAHFNVPRPEKIFIFHVFNSHVRILIPYVEKCGACNRIS